jgi:hypothetical protein
LQYRVPAGVPEPLLVEMRPVATALRPAAFRPNWRRLARGLVVLLAAVVAVLAVSSFAVGRFTRYPVSFLAPPAAGHRTPAWTRPCWRQLGHPHPYVLTCGRVRGIVLWVQHHDPDGDGDRHLLVLAGYHVVSVKIPREVAVEHLPGIASVVTATGLLDHGAHGELSIRVGTLGR